MPESPSIKFGILKCRDLVQLYYGARMVTSQNVLHLVPDSSGDVIQILKQDPRRIGLEIVLSNFGATLDSFYLSPTIDQSTIFEEFDLLTGFPIVINRSFLTEMDNICSALFASSTTGTTNLSIREIFLTSAPIDEIP